MSSLYDFVFGPGSHELFQIERFVIGYVTKVASHEGPLGKCYHTRGKRTYIVDKDSIGMLYNALALGSPIAAEYDLAPTEHIAKRVLIHHIGPYRNHGLQTLVIDGGIYLHAAGGYHGAYQSIGLGIGTKHGGGA